MKVILIVMWIAFNNYHDNYKFQEFENYQARSIIDRVTRSCTKTSCVHK